MAYSPPQRYRAPNGASVMLPPEVAGGLVGLEPDLPPVAADTPTIPTPPPVDQGMLASPPVLAPPEEPTLMGTMADMARPSLVQQLPPAAGPSAAPGEAPPEPAAPPTPAPAAPQPPLTADDIRQGGYAPVLEQQRAASALKREAGAEQIALDKRAAEAEAAAIAASNERDVRNEAERARIQQETLADIARRSAAIDSEIDRIASTKIDASVRSPVLSGIAIAMGAIGAALAGKNDGSNPALDMLLKQRDANVQRQLAERDSAVRTVGLRRDQLAGIRQRLTDSNALYDGLAAAETRRIRNELARVAASTKSESGKANLMKLDADLAAEEATFLAGAKDKQFAFDDREKQRREQERANRAADARGWASIAEQRADRADRRYQFQENLKLQYAKEENDLKRALATAKTPDAERMKELDKEARTMAIRDPTTGKPMLNAEGQKLAAQADKLDKQAEKMRASDDAGARQQAEVMAARAAELRTTARLEHSIKGNSPDHAAKVNATVHGTQNMLTLIDNVTTKIRKAGTKVLNQSELQAALETEMSLLGLEIKDLWTLGSLDDGAVSYMNKVTGGDSTKLTTAGFLGALGIGADSSEKSVARLKSLGSAVERKGRAALTQQGLEPGAFKFQRQDETERPEYKAAEKLLNARTPVERGEAKRNVGAAVRAVDVTEKFLEGAEHTPSEKRALEVELETAGKKYPGLAPEQEGAMDELLVQSRGDGPEAANARAKLLEVATSTATTRPALSNAVLNVLRDQQPDLYREAVAALPDEQRQTREGLERLGREGESLLTLEDRAVRGAPDAIQELQRRAGADRGGPASKAWMRVLGEFDRRQRAPGGQ